MRCRDSGNSSLDSSGLTWIRQQTWQTFWCIEQKYVNFLISNSLNRDLWYYIFSNFKLSDPSSSLEWKLSVRSTIPARCTSILHRLDNWDQWRITCSGQKFSFDCLYQEVRGVSESTPTASTTEQVIWKTSTSEISSLHLWNLKPFAAFFHDRDFWTLPM